MFVFETLIRPDRPISGHRATDPFAGQPLPPARHHALLIWGEHCTECAAPACYTSCDLYAPTLLGKCRRFENGIERVGTAYPPVAHVDFRQWGKLEARGPASPLPVGRAQWVERMLGVLAPAADRIGRALSRMSGDARWGKLSEHLHERLRRWIMPAGAGLSIVPDAFVAEIANPAVHAVTAQLTITVDRLAIGPDIAADHLPPPFQYRLDIPPGISTHRVPGGDFAHVVASGLPFLVSLTLDQDDRAGLTFRTLDLVWDGPTGPTPAPAALPAGPPVKCVVFDLDNTVWDGVLLEGMVALRPGIAELFAWLDQRGILISVASKNAAADAMAQLQQFGLDQYVLAPQIGWQPKSAGLAEIARVLDIGIDSFLFVDDSAFERSEVARALPMVETLPDNALADLRRHPRLAGSATAESRQRRAMYRDAATRLQAQDGFGDYLDFLRDCAIQLEIRPHQPRDFERICELVQRTNQLNFSGRKYGREEIERILADPSQPGFVITASDRFGAYGTVGFCLAQCDGGGIQVQDFMLSCRVQGKYVEQALLAYLAEFFAPFQPARVAVNFSPTARNGAARSVLERLGFAKTDGGWWEMAMPQGRFAVDFIAINPPANS